MERPLVRKRWERVGYPVEDFGPSRTQQQFLKDCDINVILQRYMRHGVDPRLPSEGMFADFSNLPDLQEAMNTVIEAETAFAGLPSKVRREFDNDPVKLLNFLQDPGNRDRAIEIGLIDPPQEFAGAGGAQPPAEAPSGAEAPSPAANGGGA